MQRRPRDSGEMHEQMDTFSCFARRQFPRNGSRALLVVGLAVVLSSCSWMGAGVVGPLLGDAEVPTGAPSTKRVYYNIDLRAEYRAIADVIRQGLGKEAGESEAVYMSEPPDHGLFYKVTLDRQPHTALSNFWMFVSALSLGILPFYDHEGERVSVRYDLYADRQFKRSYTYMVSRRGLFWLGTPLVKPFLPSDWSESVVDNQVWLGAFQATARQAMKDVKKDGALSLQ